MQQGNSCALFGTKNKRPSVFSAAVSIPLFGMSISGINDCNSVLQVVFKNWTDDRSSPSNTTVTHEFYRAELVEH